MTVEGSLNGKTCVVTGANSGIGRYVARNLALTGASVIMVCRNQSAGDTTRDEIKNETGSQKVELMLADLASLDSVRKFAEDFKAKHDRLHVLVNNAGLIIGKRTVTMDGLETTFEVNYLSHFLLTHLLLDTLKASAPSRVVNVSSDAHSYGHMDFEDLQEETRYGAMKSYSQSKLAQVLFTYELAKRLGGTGVTANCVHPGAVRTHWGDEAGILGIGIRLARPFMIGPEKGAETPTYVASSPDLEVITGKYFAKKKDTKSSNESYNEEEAKKLWNLSMKLCSLPENS